MEKYTETFSFEGSSKTLGLTESTELFAWLCSLARLCWSPWECSQTAFNSAATAQANNQSCLRCTEHYSCSHRCSHSHTNHSHAAAWLK